MKMMKDQNKILNDKLDNIQQSHIDAVEEFNPLRFGSEEYIAA